MLLSKLVLHYCDSRPDLSDGTLVKYKGFKNILGDYDIMISNIDKSYINSLYKHFLTRMNENSAHNRMKQLSFFMDHAIAEQLITANPVKNMKFYKPEVEIIYLNDNELATIMNKKLIGRLSEVRDIFVFQCFTAMEYSRLFTFKTFINDQDGRLWIKSYRKKTKKEATLPMLPAALEIWEKYDRKLPLKSNAKLNGYLKEIQDICGIDKVLHTHLSRHTFATTICLLNFITESTTAKMMGISVKELIKTYGKIVSKRVSMETNIFFEKELGMFHKKCTVFSI